MCKFIDARSKCLSVNKMISKFVLVLILVFSYVRIFVEIPKLDPIIDRIKIKGNKINDNFLRFILKLAISFSVGAGLVVLVRLIVAQ